MEARGLWAWETGDTNAWAHGTDLDGYLEAWAACLDGRDFDLAEWVDLAKLVTMGKVYE